MKQIDRDFFRAMAHERAESMPQLPDGCGIHFAANAIVIAHDELLRIAEGERSNAKIMDALAHISALCERAAVDVVLPQCSTRNKVSALQKSMNQNGARGGLRQAGTRPTSKGKS